MKTKKFLQKMILELGRVMPGVACVLLTRQALANPTGMTIQSGNATLTVNGSRLTVTAGNNAFLNWQSFNIASGETTVFNQPSSTSIVWNRINGQNPSQIYGSLQANGVVVLLNSSGFYFGPNSFVSAAGLVVSTANCTPPQNSGGAWEFNGPPPMASIVNYGQIQIGQQGSCFLIADQVENQGTISAPGGTVGLVAGKTVKLSERPDGRGLSMDVTLPQGSVDNYGTLIADAGTISLSAKVVNQDGFIQANSVQNKNGVIELVAGDQLNLGANSAITANGDASPGGSAGGTITLKSENTFSDVTGSEISVTGGANGGNGGSVEISAPAMTAIHSTVDGTAKAGSTGGKLLLDPDYIVLDTSGSDSAGSGTVAAGDNPGTTLDLNVNSAFTGLSQITLQAAYDITLADNTAWDLSASTGQSNGKLVLEAGGNIIFGNYTSISDANNWSVALYAGVSDFANKIVTPGTGSILLNPVDPNNSQIINGYIQTAAGNITMVAGQDITVGTGYVNTTAGGNITAHALAGSIDTGGYPQGYVFQGAGSASTGYDVDPGFGVGGISTRAGGDVSLTAGGNVTSVLPVHGGYYYDGVFYNANQSSFPNMSPDYMVTAGAGAYGPEAGNVTIIAGGNVTGNYIVANGTGKIYAGVTMDANGNPEMSGGNYVLGSTGSAGVRSALSDPSYDLSLNLVRGGWNVTAAQNIVLDEVSNPNGTFNAVDSTTLSYHAFDYSPSAYVNLNAGNEVQLGETAGVLPRLDNLRVPIIYPGILNVTAGAGGVEFYGDSTYKQLILYPSPQGSLTINTTDGGSVIGDLFSSDGITPIIYSLIVSDSGNTRYTSSTAGLFGINDHAATPVHSGSETPIQLNVSGDMDYLMLGAPEAAQINVVGNMNDCRFQGMNLSGSDTTSINVGKAAKISMENSGILNSATDGGLTVGGNINNRSAFTSVSIPSTSAPNLSLLADALNNTVDGVAISAATLMASFYYTAGSGSSAGGTFTYQTIANVKVADVLNLLQHLTVQARNPDGSLKFDSNNNPVTTQVSLFSSPAAATAAITAMVTEYNQLGQPPTGAGGFTLGGGGTFAFNANSMDLGTTTGIQSRGVGLYSVAGAYPLANYFSHGANIDINLTGDLTMYSSAIASLNGGSISIDAGGSVEVGSSVFSVSALGARGIFSTGQGDVTVIANKDVDVNGSRIAAYDGGNVTVESLNGDVNAGTGGFGFVVVSSFIVDPTTHKVIAQAPTIPGSGILATTFPNDKGQVVGNILVETPNGNINASSGGVVQLPLNGVNTAASTVEVLAGYELRDANGHPVTAAGISSGTPVQVATGKNIDASGSGVIGSTVDLKATGDIKGAIFARNNINISAQQNVSVTALAQGSISVSSGGTVSGTLIGVGGVSASGSSIDASLESNNGISGDTSGSKGLAAGTAANATSSAASASDSSTAANTTKTDTSGDDDPLKKKKGITLARKVSRVTVILPGKN